MTNSLVGLTLDRCLSWFRNLNPIAVSFFFICLPFETKSEVPLVGVGRRKPTGVDEGRKSLLCDAGCELQLGGIN